MHKLICFFDTETTGVRTNKDGVVEIGAFMERLVDEPPFLEGKPWVLLNGYCNPNMSIPSGASNVHKIYDHCVVDKPVDSIYTWYLASYLMQMGGPETVLLAGHNIGSFDVPMLAKFAPSLRNYTCVDTLTLSRRVFKDAPNHKLGTLYDYLKGPEMEGDAHAALYDCRMSRHILTSVIAQQGEQSLDTFLEWVRDEPPITSMPFGKHKDKELTEVPTDYLLYIFREFELQPPLRAAVKNELQNRNSLEE